MLRREHQFEMMRFLSSLSLFFSLAIRCSNDFNCELSLNSILESFDFSAMPYFIYIERKTTTKSSSNNNNCRNKTNDHWLTQNFTQFFQYSSSLLCINNFFFRSGLCSILFLWLRLLFDIRVVADGETKIWADSFNLYTNTIKMNWFFKRTYKIKWQKLEAD